jgi:exosortase
MTLPWVSFVALLAALGWLLRPMLATLHATWNDIYGAHSHGYLVLALALGFAIRAWRAPPALAPSKPVWSALPALLLLLAVALAAELLYIGPSRTALLPLLLLAAIALCLGGQALRRLAWPVLFLYFALPVWVPLNEPLRRLTTLVSQALVRATGVPVFVEGNLVHLPEGTFEIASGCSGLNYFVAALTLAAVQGTLYLRTRRSRLLLVVAAALAALVANWLRVSSLIVIGHLTQMQHYLIRVDHLWYGWALFLLVMLPVYAWGVHLEKREEAGAVPVRAPTPVAPWMTRAAGLLLWGLCGVVALGGVALAASHRSEGELQGMERQLDRLGGRNSGSDFPSGWAPQFVGAEVTRRRWEVQAGRPAPVELFLAYYPRQAQEARISNPANTLVGWRWQTLEEGQHEGWRELRGTDAGRERLVWMRYEVAGHGAWSKPTLRAREAQALLGGRRDGTAVALMAECIPDCEGARDSIRAVLAAE